MATLRDDLLDDYRVARAGPLGFALHVAGILWCSRNNETFIPHGRIPCLLELTGAAIGRADESWDHHEDVEADALAKWLVDCDLWKDVPGGYEVIVDAPRAESPTVAARIIEQLDRIEEGARYVAVEGIDALRDDVTKIKQHLLGASPPPEPAKTNVVELSARRDSHPTK